MGNRSLMDRTPDSDSGIAGSIPAGCIFLTDMAEQIALPYNIGETLTDERLSDWNICACRYAHR